MKSTPPSLPTNRAFVVQLRAEARVEQGEFSGRVEHLVSMRATRFQSLEELATFLRETVLGLEVEKDETKEKRISSSSLCGRGTHRLRGENEVRTEN
jgi:hypothetical protein